MKLSPMPASGIPGSQLSTPANEGLNPAEASVMDKQAQRMQDSLRRIKMKTKRPEELEKIVTEAAEVPAEGAILDEVEPTNEAIEDTKPLSPQLVALAKQRRALQVKERELLDKEKALEQRASLNGSEDLIARIKSQPLSVLQENGVTYDQLTEAILADQSGTNPKIQELEAKIKSLEDGVNKNFVDRDTQAEQQVLTEMLSEAEALAQEGDDFSVIRDEGEEAYKKVLTRIYSHFKKTGQVLEIRSEMEKLENELIDKRLKSAEIGKVKSRLLESQQPQLQTQQKPNGMRTLTNRDSASPGLSRRDRAIMAMNGTLKRG